jgi:hypothetical protein
MNPPAHSLGDLIAGLKRMPADARSAVLEKLTDRERARLRAHISEETPVFSPALAALVDAVRRGAQPAGLTPAAAEALRVAAQPFGVQPLEDLLDGHTVPHSLFSRLIGAKR